MKGEPVHEQASTVHATSLFANRVEHRAREAKDNEGEESA